MLKATRSNSLLLLPLLLTTPMMARAQDLDKSPENLVPLANLKPFDVKLQGNKALEGENLAWGYWHPAVWDGSSVAKLSYGMVPDSIEPAFSISNYGPKGAGQIYTVPEQVKLEAGKYRLSFDYRTRNGESARFNFDFPKTKTEWLTIDRQTPVSNSKPNSNAGQSLGLVATKGQWAPFEMEFTLRAPSSLGLAFQSWQVSSQEGPAATYDFKKIRLQKTGTSKVAPEYLESLKQEELAKTQAEAQRRVVKQVDASKITGARIDESTIREILYVDPKGGANGNGSKNRPFATFGAALEQAKTNLKALIPTKIILAAGTYREGEYTLSGGELNKPNNPIDETLLVIEGAERGKTILSGSDVFAAGEWTAVKDEAGRVLFYEHPWNYDFGNTGGPWGQYNPKKLLGHRREMVFVNGEPLKQVILEDYEYTPAQGWGGQGQHVYKNFLSPAQVLQPGTFGIAERDENGNKIFVRPPAGVTWNAAQIEVAIRKHLFWSHYKSNLLLRNLTFQHTASNHDTNSAAVMIGHWHHLQNKLQNNNILIEGCEMRYNNGFGLKMGRGQNFTVRDTSSRYNGYSGVNTGTMKNTLIENCDLSFNNWRGHMGNFYGWAIGGIKMHEMLDCRLQGVTANGNMGPGIWFDINNANCIVENSTAIGNRRGIFLEISPGPFLIRNCIVAADQHVGLVLTNAANVTVENSVFYRSVNQLVSVVNNDARTASNTIEVSLGLEEPKQKLMLQGSTLLRNNIFVNPHAGGDLVRMDPSNPKLYDEWLKTLLKSESNTWFSPKSQPFGIAYDKRQMVEFPKWQAFTAQDLTSNLTDPMFLAPDNFDFRVAANSSIRSKIPALPRVPATLRQNIEAFFSRWDYKGNFDYKDDPLAVKKD